MPPTLIPAWRRLGLQLKNEENGASTAAPAVQDGGGQNAPKKRKRSSLDEREAKSLKPTLALDLNGVSDVRRPSTPNGKVFHTPLETPSPKKGKSVSFTPDTKVQDGGRDMSEFYEGNSDSDESFEEEVIPPPKLRKAPQPATPATNGAKPDLTPEETTKKAKKPKKEKNAKAAAPSGDEGEHIAPQLQYLREYEHSRPTWKFNKAKQNWLLKHALDLDKIPATFDTSLVAYMQGLDNAAARSRLHTSAKAVLDADTAALKEELADASEPPASSPQAALIDRIDSARHRQQAYERVLAAFSKRAEDSVAQTEEAELLEDPVWKQRLLKRKRAQRLVWGVNDPAAELQAETPDIAHAKRVRAHREATAEGSKPANATVQETTVRTGGDASGDKRRRRKRRRRNTGIPDDESDSSESDVEPAMNAKKVAKKLIAAPGKMLAPGDGSDESTSDEGTSSSGSSSDG